MRARRLLIPVAFVVACGDGVVVLEDPGDPEGAGGASAATAQAASGTSQATGGTTTAGGGGAGGATICATYGNPCNECVAQACPEVWCACSDDPECFDLTQCFQGCNLDEACQQACLTTHEDAISKVVQVNGCKGTTCAGSCVGGNPDYDDCSACVFSSCAPAMNACLANPACGALFQCFRACPKLDLTCQQDCFDAYPDGVEDLQSALMCADAECQPVCGDP